MTTRPAWMDALNLFDYGFNTVMDLFFVVFGLMIIAVVSRPSLRQHLSWANPSAIGCILTGCARFLRDMHFFLGFGARYSVSLTSTMLYYIATLFAAYSTYKLWQRLRDLALNPAAPDPLIEHSAQPGVWPPPPVTRS